MLFGNPMDKIEKLAAKGKSDKLASFIKNKDKNVSLAAIRALGSCDDETSFNTLTGLIIADDPDVRIAALEGLGKMGKSASFTHISNYVNRESDPRVKKAMQEALTAISAKTKHGA